MILGTILDSSPQLCMHVWIENECISSHDLQQSYFSIVLTAAIDLKDICSVRVPPRTGPINSLNRMEKSL